MRDDDDDDRREREREREREENLIKNCAPLGRTCCVILDFFGRRVLLSIFLTHLSLVILKI